MTKFSISSLKAKAAQHSGEKIKDAEWEKLADAMNNAMRGSKAISFVMGLPQPGKSDLFADVWLDASGVMHSSICAIPKPT